MPRYLLAATLTLLCAVLSVSAQELKSTSTNPDPVVTFNGSGQRVRFTASSSVVQMHVQVYDDAGNLLFDASSKGNVFDWTMQGGSGQLLINGNYLCVVTVKSVSGKLSQRIGGALVRDNQVELHEADAKNFTAAQQQAVGPIEENAALTILAPTGPDAATVIAHDGKNGQVVRSSGALSFRLGDFYAGKDAEQMHLTEDGKLGIGTDKPRTKLDVAGDISASGTVRADKVEFADGTVQTSGLSGRVREDGTLVPNVSGTGTQNRIAKWIDNAAALGDSVLTDTGTNVGLGVAAPGDLLDIAGAPNAAGRSGIQHVRTTSTTGNATLYFDNDRNNFAAYGGVLTGGSANPFTFFGLTRADKTFLIADGPSSLGLGIGTLVSRPVVFGTANIERMRIESSGNVGIGTTSPVSRLDVTGSINTSTQYNIGNARVLSVPVTNTLVGLATGAALTTGEGNTFVGNSAGLSTTSGSSNAFVGSNAGRGNLSGGGNSYFGIDAGFVNTAGNFNSFFGNQAGRNNTASNNSFFGQNAGFSNTTGTFNSFFGYQSGFANNEGFFNSFYGYRAGASTVGPSASANSFFGNQAGEANSSGASNAFFGASAGQNNSSGNGNSFFGTSAGFFNTDTINNSIFGFEAGLNNAASGNSFFGFSAGRANTTGVNNAFFGGFSGQANTASGNSFFGRSAGALNTSGADNAFFGSSAGQSNTEACCNAFFGANAGFGNTTGTNNSFFGNGAGSDNLTGSDNSYFGAQAGTVTTASNNSFFGSLAGDINTDGANNAFFGRNAGGANTSGSNNSFFGESSASANSTGSGNVVIGNVAGLNLVTGDNNIYISNAGANESNRIRIGTEGTQTATFIAGINGVNVNPSTSVVVDTNGQLGVIVSSRRFKTDIRNMGDASSKLMSLRPVTFHYRPEFVSGGQTLQYGLIAEEVAKVDRDLVAFGPDGKPQTVRYHLLSPMMLNELQRQEMRIQSQAHLLQGQAQRIAALEKRLHRLEKRKTRRTRR